MAQATRNGEPWLDEIQLPELDLLVAEQPPELAPDALAEWLGVGAVPVAENVSPVHLLSSGGNSSGTISTKSLTTEENRIEKAKALNRAKQNRYRQRQKERKEQFAVQYEATAADLEREQQLNASIKLSGATLECLRDQKDAVVQILEAAAAADHSRSQDVGQDAPCSTELADQLWAMPFRERVVLCRQIFCQSEPARRALLAQASRSVSSQPDGFALNNELRIKLAGQMVTHHPEVLKAAVSVSPEMLLKDWAELGELAAEVIQLFDGGVITEEEVEARMCDSVMYFAILGALLFKHKPEVLQCLANHTRLPGETDGQAAARWREVAIGGRVTKEEMQPLIPLYQTYCERMQQLGNDTADVLSLLQEVQQRMNEQLLATGLSAAAQEYLRVFDAAAQLSQQSIGALLIPMEFKFAAGAHVTPLQKTRMIAQCRPLNIDVASIVREGLAYYDLLPSDHSKATPLALMPAPPASVSAASADQKQHE